MILAVVEWVDSRGGPEGWERKSEATSMDICRAKSVGWVIREDSESIMLASHIIGDDDPQVSGVVCIPKQAITSMDVVEDPTLDDS